MYYEDLTPFRYDKFRDESFVTSGALNIGWLDSGHEFHRGLLDEKIINKLKKITFDQQPIKLTRGYQTCPFCTSFNEELGIDMPVSAQWEGREKLLGSGILVLKGDSVTYVFPDLLIHYIEAHDYHPPEEFLDAVSNHKAPE